MQFTTLYDTGATVWVIVAKPEMVRATCTTCNSTGAVTLGGESLRCPKCNGRKEPTGAVTQQALSLVVDRVAASSPSAIRYFGTREDGKHVAVPEAEVFATKLLAEAAAH